MKKKNLKKTSPISYESSFRQGRTSSYGVTSSCFRNIVNRIAMSALRTDVATDSMKFSLMTTLMISYAITAIIVDTLATNGKIFIINWSTFYWKLNCGFEVSTFLLWTIIPFTLMLIVDSPRSFDWQLFTCSRWKKIDLLILFIIFLFGVFAILSIKFIPVLRNYYTSRANLDSPAKLEYAINTIIWTLSWLIGWEFLHRVYLFKYLHILFGKLGICLIPILEFTYHLIKSLPEAFAMLIFSIAVTYWCYVRKNALLPFLAHFFIEITLLLFVLFI
ncbi:MAG: hypothetical protein HQK51_02705 [Oligoflexia bacterium]|nr:hypothetical protein [Oligoflexia bacterium]